MFTSKPVVIAFVILCIVLLAVAPIISIWALNTLFVGVIFTAAIELNIWTYLAMIWFAGMIGVGTKAISN